MNLIFSEDAIQDLYDIKAYISQSSEANARRVLDALRDTCRVVATQPSIGERCDQYGAGLRRITTVRHVIYFLPKPDLNEVEIVRILHGARNIDSLF